MAAERPYLLAPVQGLLVQRSGILWQLYGRRVWLRKKLHPFTTLEWLSVAYEVAMFRCFWLLSNSSNAAGRLMRVRTLRTRLVERPIVHDQR